MRALKETMIETINTHTQFTFMPENSIRKTMHCKGTIPGTNLKCRAELCETDGEIINLKLDSGRELQIKTKRSKAFGLICDACGYETVWYEKRSIS